MIDKKILLLILLGGGLASSIIVMNFLFLREIEAVFSTVNIIAGLIFAFPIIMLKYTEYSRNKEIEEMFPVFLRDFVESARAGMPVPQALKSLKRNDYKALNFYVKKMAAQTDWGIPVDKIFLKFSKEVKSKLIGRIISSVIESHRFGGNLADTFEALSNTSFEVEKLKGERRLYLNSQMITGYIIFFVFLAVIVGLGRFLIPSLSQVGGEGMTLVTQPAQENLVNEYKSIFRNLIVIQGLFAGLSVGKMAEGAIISGMKHSLFMMLIGILVFTIMG
jgi:pilus assembly protein TadC